MKLIVFYLGLCGVVCALPHPVHISQGGDGADAGVGGADGAGADIADVGGAGVGGAGVGGAGAGAGVGGAGVGGAGVGGAGVGGAGVGGVGGAGAGASDPGLDITTFHSHADLTSWLQNLAATYPHLCEVVTIGHSSDGRPILLMKIGTTRHEPGTPAVWIDAGIHANEWISPATAAWIVWQLLSGYESGSTVELVDSLVWYVNVVFNPDGYEYSRHGDRLWRKTRTTSGGGGACSGADPDRNWDVAWGETGSSTDPCSEIYAGAAAHSEPCVAAAASALGAVAADVKAYLALHSYGQLWMYPYAWTGTVCADCQELRRAGQAAVDRLSSLYHTQYLVGGTHELLHPFSGSSVDYAYAKLGIKYSFYIELRDDGRYGFLVPPAFISRTGEETWLGVQYIAQAVLEAHNTE